MKGPTNECMLVNELGWLEQGWSDTRITHTHNGIVSLSVGNCRRSHRHSPNATFHLQCVLSTATGERLSTLRDDSLLDTRCRRDNTH